MNHKTPFYLFFRKQAIGMAICISILFLSACGGGDEPEIIEEDLSHEEEQIITECDCKELVYDPKYNYFYLDDRLDEYTGGCTEYYPNGKVKFTKNFIDGKIDGEYKAYYENGQLKESKYFEDNFQERYHTLFSENGDTNQQFYYERGRMTIQTYPKK